MSMIEVDPKLFITCRLCLDEMGLYQIVPKVQIQIKYCFEIDVQPFDGLPQLICKKCESILSQYAATKHMYQVKQNSLKTIKKSDQLTPKESTEELNEINNVQQQDTVSSTQQVETVSGSTSISTSTGTGTSTSTSTGISTGLVKKTNKQKLSLKKRVCSVDCESSGSKSKDTSPIKPLTITNNEKIKPTNNPRRTKFAWASNYTKQFVCRICSKTFTKIRYVNAHLNKHENLVTKYSNVLNTHCEVKMNKVGSTLNKTNTDDNVVISENKIIKSVNSKYYIVYNSKTKKKRLSSESSDDAIVRYVGKYKRQRLDSEDSVKTIQHDETQNSIDIDKQTPVNQTSEGQTPCSFIDCVNIDSDSTSTHSDKITKVKEKPQKKLYVNKKLISNIITMCYNKYLKRFDDKNISKVPGNLDSSLQHKVLSIGTKIIHSRGPNSTGLLRYLEHKNLDITWKQTKDSNSLIIVKTSLVNAKSNNNDNNDLGWKNLKEVDQNYTVKDFADLFENLPPDEYSPPLNEQELTSETSQQNDVEKEISKSISPMIFSEENINMKTNVTDTFNPPEGKSTVSETSEDAVLLLRTALETDKQLCKKILNASPVPYPKQLPNKKTGVNEPSTLMRSPPHAPGSMEPPRSDLTSMPIITSTMSLAPLAEGQKHKQNNSKTSQDAPSNRSEPTLPQIKVKPISELMPDKGVQSNTSLVNMSGWTVTSSNSNDRVLHASNPNLVYVANVPQYSNVAPQQPAVVCYPQILCSVSQANTSETEIRRNCDTNGRTKRKSNQEFVFMHTVELPNTKTSSPFRYFQRLLQIHNLVLLESTVAIPYNTMKCLIKFSLGFQQENNAPVTLCLTLYCDKNVFCIKVRDNALKDMDVSKLSANWQWEILKVFKGDIVNKLNINALKHGLDMSAKVNHFLSLLKAIVFSKEK